MTLERDGKEIKGLTGKQHDTDSLYLKLTDDLKNGGKDGEAFKTDLAQANKVLHENGFPDLVISGIDPDNGKFLTNKGVFDGTQLNRRLDSTEETNDPKLDVHKNKVGNVDNVALSNEQERKFEYTKDGKTLVAYTDINGDRFEKNDQSVWVYKDKNGATNDAKNLKEVSVDENGVVTTKSGDESVVTKAYPNGRIEITAADHSEVIENGTSIWKNKDNTYEKITYPPNSGRGVVDMNFDGEGKICRVREQIGEGEPTVIVDNTSGKVADMNGIPVTATVDSNGKLTIQHTEESTYKGVGVINPDGSGWTKDGYGRLVEAQQNGQKTTFNRDPKDGKLTGITRGETTVASRDGDNWSDGKNALMEEPTIDDSGNVTLNYKNAKVSVSPDGASTFTGHRRTTIEVSSDGKTAGRVVQPKDTLWAIAEDNWSRMHDAKKPSVKEIQAEMDRIVAKYNEKHKGQEIKDKNRIGVKIEFDLT